MIRRSPLALFSLILFPLALALVAGCQGSTAPTPKAASTPVEPKPVDSNAMDPEVKASLDKLSPEDRTFAVAQKTCPITGEPLGSMGVPLKLTLKDQVVFLCCSSCKKKAESDPEKTLKAVADAKAKSTGK